MKLANTGDLEQAGDVRRSRLQEDQAGSPPGRAPVGQEDRSEARGVDELQISEIEDDGTTSGPGLAVLENGVQLIGRDQVQFALQPDEQAVIPLLDGHLEGGIVHVATLTPGHRPSQRR